MDEDGPDLAELTCDPFEIAGVRFDDIIDAKALGPEAVLAQRLGERACRVNSADVENVRAGPHHVADRAAQIVDVAACRHHPSLPVSTRKARAVIAHREDRKNGQCRRAPMYPDGLQTPETRRGGK